MIIDSFPILNILILGSSMLFAAWQLADLKTADNR